MSFDLFISDRTRDFTGREWVFRAVNDWLTDPPGRRVFLLTGEPGSGKSAVAARLAQLSAGIVAEPSAPALCRGWLTHHHFCQAGLESTLSPLTFVQSLSESLANRYPAFRIALENAGSRQIVINQNVGTAQAGSNVIGAQISQIRIEIKGGDARPLFDQAVRLPLLELCKQLPTENIVILVDSLDEALTFNAENNITQLLKLVSDFPPRARFILTCRSNDNRVFDLVGRPTLDLINDALRGLDEVKLYSASRLHSVQEPQRGAAATRIAEKSHGNFLYAFHVVNDLVARGADIGDTDGLDLPDELEGVYRKFIERELASNPARWNDIYRPLLGPITVARGNGVTKPQLIGITDLAEDTVDDVLKVCSQYLVGGETKEGPYRIYHQSFRDFLLWDKKFTVYPAERHAAIGRYLHERYGSNWRECNDEYALRYTPAHWADSAALSEHKRETRTQSLIGVLSNRKYQRRFEVFIGDLPLLHEYLHQAVHVAALNERSDMMSWLIKAANAFVGFRRDYLQGESVVTLAEEGKLEQSIARLPLFVDVDEDWKLAAQLIISWLAAGRDPGAAQRLCDRIGQGLPALDPLRLLRDRTVAALGHQSSFPFESQQALALEVGQELVNRVSGQAFDRELLGSVNPSLIATLGFQSRTIGQRGYAASLDAPILVNISREYGSDGTAQVDEYINAHAGYNYVEYRNRSLWLVLQAVLRHHPDQDWVKQRLRRILVAALSGGGIDFREMLPMTAATLVEDAGSADARLILDKWRSVALALANQLQEGRRASDSWAITKRRLTSLMELFQLLLADSHEAEALLSHIRALPGGFAGFQAPAQLRLADALLACHLGTPGMLNDTIEDALRTAHHIQDYHFCARVTARCSALKRWHQRPLRGKDLADTICHLARSPSDAEFAADHLIHEDYKYRDDPDALPIDIARQAETLEQLVEVFQRSAVEFRRLNPQYGLTESLDDKTPISVPDPGLACLLAIHLAARALADNSLAEERSALIRMLVPVAVNNTTALDTVLSYLLLATRPDDPELLQEVVREAGPVVFGNVAPSMTQIGPDAVTPS